MWNKKLIPNVNHYNVARKNEFNYLFDTGENRRNNSNSSDVKIDVSSFRNQQYFLFDSSNLWQWKLLVTDTNSYIHYVCVII